MKILITGGTGLIGRALARTLLEAGHDVFILSRNPAGVVAPNGAKIYGWDGETDRGWGQFVEQADAVVNLAGENIGAGRWSEERKERILQSRVRAGKAIVEAIHNAKDKPAVLIQASAVGYYGVHGDEMIDESAPAGDDFLAGVAKVWEESTKPVEELGIRRVIIRSGIVLDPNQGALPRLLKPFRLFAGGPLGSGAQWMPWIHLQDEVGAIIHLLKDSRSSGVYNLCAPEPVRNADFGKAVSRVLKSPYWIPVPAFVLRLLLGEMSTLVLDGQRAVPLRLMNNGYQFKFEKVDKALLDLLKW
jgi:uncharacterized protein (TIGR01777 family)